MSGQPVRLATSGPTRRSIALGTGPALLALDCIGLLLLWPATVLLAAPTLSGLHSAAALIVYPAFALLTLYALGL